MTGPIVLESCPPQDELARFQRGEVFGGRLDELSDHLTTCGSCQSSLAGMTVVNDGLLSELREIRELAEPDERSLVAEIAALESISTDAFGRSQAARDSTIETRKLPQRLAEYDIVESIGSGGMGAVYRAVHTRLGKTVAIKALLPQRLGDEGALARFEREIRAIGKLNHPHIVAATDAREIEGSLFLVMEFVDGVDVARLVKRHGPLPVAEACEIVRQAALGLQYIHSHGLVHRDIKPSNLLLTLAPDQPSGGLVKVADLGLALLHETERGANAASSVNLVIGSLDYMAPEQADNSHKVDQRADLYSLGCTLYELLAGRPPYALPGQTPLQKLKAHSDASLPALAGVCANLPDGLRPLVRKLLAKGPADRLAAASELAAALQPFATGANLAALLNENPQSAPGSHRPPAAPPRRRKRWMAGALATIAALAAVIYVQTDRGVLEIKSDESEVKVRVEQDGKLITLIDLKSNKEFRLPSGKYQAALGEADHDFTLDADEFTVRRGGKAVLEVRRKPPPLLRTPFDGDEAKRHQALWAKFGQAPEAITNDTGMKLTLIPPGEFEMRPGYQVKITKPYYLGTHEVTVAQFRQFAEAAGYKSPLESEGRGVKNNNTLEEMSGMHWRNPALARGDDHPVVGVTWNDASRFCAWLSERENKKYRLPTEAEWEWAARGGSASNYAWGDDDGRAGEFEWCSGDSEMHTHPVGQKTPTAWGLFDTNGNAVEWVQDWCRDPYPQGDATDPVGPTLGVNCRVLRGGSFLDSPLPFLSRGSFDPAHSMIHCGFRVCREL